jgi:hypothetical protein
MMDFGGSASTVEGAANLATSLISLYQSQMPSAKVKMDMNRWLAVAKPVTGVLSGLFYNPNMGEQQGYRNTDTDVGQYKFAPSKSMQDIYSNYLGRTYGMPTQISNHMMASAIAPVKYSNIKRGMSSAAMRSSSRLSPEVLSKAMLNVQAPKGMEQMDYLKNAGSLASFNAWRAKQLGELVG